MLLSGVRTPMGPCVWVQAADGVDIVLISKRNQVIGADLFTGLGIDLAAKKLVIVKSAQHFHAEFGPLAKSVLYVSTPASLSDSALMAASLGPASVHHELSKSRIARSRSLSPIACSLSPRAPHYKHPR